jgi:DNA-binding ferritin-like protein (Dps family)
VTWLTQTIDQKRRYRQYRARIDQLPPNYLSAIEALERYVMYRGAVTRADVLMAMLDDLADLFELSAANGSSIRTVVGEDPVEFAEAFLQNYAEGQWIERERQRLAEAIAHAAGEVPGKEGRSNS